MQGDVARQARGEGFQGFTPGCPTSKAGWPTSAASPALVVSSSCSDLLQCSPWSPSETLCLCRRIPLLAKVACDNRCSLSPLSGRSPRRRGRPPRRPVSCRSSSTSVKLPRIRYGKSSASLSSSSSAWSHHQAVGEPAQFTDTPIRSEFTVSSVQA